MKRKSTLLIGALLVGFVAVIVLVNRIGEAQAPGNPATDPQTLMIPRWFLTSLTLQGKNISLPETHLTLQFEEGGKANGQGGCNNFGTTYQVSKDGKLSFGQTVSTMMACDKGMDAEGAYFQALSEIQQFRRDGGKLILSSADGKTSLVFSMPPK